MPHRRRTLFLPLLLLELAPGLLDCQQFIDQIPESAYSRLGRVCIENGGIDACDPLTGAVQPATWGQIKATYR